MRHRSATNREKGTSPPPKGGAHHPQWTELDPNLARALHDAVIHRMVR